MDPIKRLALMVGGGIALFVVEQTMPQEWVGALVDIPIAGLLLFLPWAVYDAGDKFAPKPNVGCEQCIFLDDNRTIDKYIDEFTQDDWEEIRSHLDFSEYFALREQLKDFQEAKRLWYLRIFIAISSGGLCIFIFIMWLPFALHPH